MRNPELCKGLLERILPDNQEVRYSIPIVKVQEYTKEDILNKQLFFFTPYYILKFEKELERIDADEEKVKNLTKDYQEIYERLKILEDQKMVDSTYLYNLVVLTERLVKIVADKQTNIKREVNTMGGRVLELESDKIMERGRKEGKEQVAQKMLEEKIDAGTIVKVTGLTEKELKQIEKDMLVSL